MASDSTNLVICVALSCFVAAAGTSKPYFSSSVVRYSSNFPGGPKPYSYVVQYSRNFKDSRGERTQPGPASRHAPITARTHEHRPRSAPRRAPRLIVEEVRKIVEISIQEGYERGGYDHRHYQTHNTTWSEYENEEEYSEGKQEGSKIGSGDYSSKVGLGRIL
ncbi:hypothetical protein E2C01_083939 [Portunus trituberculatus]|uniref:Uncharacterized protein n=1 Tax=Portunus trituberculatus TaxID=210409 RepID=A0A5B7IU01_PORTR|nr:hypothetical protein [Portunus trituberculatus]